MFDLDLIRRARWDELYNFFAAGNPPIALQLLVINTIFLVLFIIRRASARHRMRHSTMYAVQGLLVAANVMVLFSKDLYGLFNKVSGWF